jgi:hypothetical protein
MPSPFGPGRFARVAILSPDRLAANRTGVSGGPETPATRKFAASRAGRPQ